MLKKALFVLVLFVVSLFSLAPAEASSIFESHSREQLVEVIQKTDTKYQNSPVRQVIVFNEQDSVQIQQIISEFGHKVINLNKARINNHPGEFQYRITYKK